MDLLFLLPHSRYDISQLFSQLLCHQYTCNARVKL
jgi:hypothetical protein